MAKETRYYIKHRHRGDFLTKLDFLTNFEYIHPYSYSPNIFEFPLSFRSITSIEDYLENCISYHFRRSPTSKIRQLEEIKNLIIVETCSDTFGVDSTFSEMHGFSIEETFRKAFWVVKSFFKYKTSCTNYYISLTDFHNRSLAQYHNTNRYIIPTQTMKISLGPLLDLCFEQGIKTEQYGLLVILDSEEDVNFLKLSNIDITDIVTTKELMDLESEIKWCWEFSLE